VVVTACVVVAALELVLVVETTWEVEADVEVVVGADVELTEELVLIGVLVLVVEEVLSWVVVLVVPGADVAAVVPAVETLVDWVAVLVWLEVLGAALVAACVVVLLEGAAEELLLVALEVVSAKATPVGTSGQATSADRTATRARAATRRPTGRKLNECAKVFRQSWSLYCVPPEPARRDRCPASRPIGAPRLLPH
jgi:hypothetical protein